MPARRRPSSNLACLAIVVSLVAIDSNWTNVTAQTRAVKVPSFLVFAASAPSLPAKMCEPNHILVDHPIGGYHFATASWYNYTKTVHLYTTCVENRGSNTVYIDWPIPGPKKNYISAGDSAYGPRYFPDHNTVGVLGCLVYGSYRMSIKEQFLGHGEDIQRAGEDQDCSKARSGQFASLTPMTEAPWFETKEAGRASFPSDAKDIDGTLIRLNYWISLRPGPDKRYTIDFIYQAGAAFPEKFHGNIGDVSVRGSPDILSAAIKETRHNDGVLRLEEYKGVLVVSPEMPQKYTISNASYDFFDRNGEPVASIYVPVLVPY